MSDSAIPAVKTALTTAFSASSGLSGVTVKRGLPDPNVTEALYIWNATSTRNFASLGRQPTPLDEDISIQLVADCYQASGTDFEPTETRAFAIATAAEDAIRADVTLGGVWRFSHISELRQEYTREKDMRGCRVSFTLSGKARI